MSANPEAFDYLRQNAYKFVRRHGRDFAALHAHLRALLLTWRQQNSHLDLGSFDAKALPRDIARWCVDQYEAPRRPPGRTDADRDHFAEFVFDRHESLISRGNKVSIRTLAKITGASKSKVGRIVLDYTRRLARRKAKASLGHRAQQILALIEMNFYPTDVRLVFSLDGIGKALAYPRNSQKASAVSMRRNRTVAAFLEIVSHPALGYAIDRQGQDIAVWRSSENTNVDEPSRDTERSATTDNGRAVYAQTQKERRVQVHYTHIPPRLFWGAFGASNEAVEVAALGNVEQKSIWPPDYWEMMWVVWPYMPNEQIYRTIREALRKEMNLHRYLKGAKRYLTLPADEMGVIDRICEFLGHLGMLGRVGPVGGELFFLLNKFGHVDRINERGSDARRRFDFIIFLLELPKGIDAFTDFLWLERAGKWRFRPELSDDENIPTDFSRDYPWRLPRKDENGSSTVV